MVVRTGDIVDTAAAAIDVAQEGVVAGGYAACLVGEGVCCKGAAVVFDAVDCGVGGIGAFRRVVACPLAAYDAGGDIDVGVLCHVAVGTAAEDGAAHIGEGVDAVDGGIFDVYLGVVDIGHVVDIAAC